MDRFVFLFALLGNIFPLSMMYSFPTLPVQEGESKNVYRPAMYQGPRRVKGL